MTPTRHRPRTRFLALVLTAVLIGVGLDPGVSAAAAAFTACDLSPDSAQPFAVSENPGDAVTVRAGCARQAGNLRSLARDDTDMVVALDAHDADQRAFLQQEVDRIVAYQNDGYQLSDYLQAWADKYDSHLFQGSQGISDDYDGLVRMVGDSMVVVTASADLGIAEASSFQKLLAGLVGFAVGAGISGVCMYLVANPTLAWLCGAIGGFFGGAVGELLTAKFDGKDMSSQKVWADALAMAIVGAISGGSMGLLTDVVARGAESFVAKAVLTLRTTAARLWWGREALNWLAGAFDGFGPVIREAVLRAARQVGAQQAQGLGTQLRVLPVGDTLTAGTGSPDLSGFRSALNSALTSQGAQVAFVGSQHSGPQPDSHEGHPAWLISDFGGIVSRLASYQPSVVLLQVGTNDLAGNVDPAGAPARLGALLDRIIAATPDAAVVVSTVVRSASPAIQERVNAYNLALAGVVTARRDAGGRVLLTDLGAVSAADLAGAVLTETGYGKVASAFSYGILSTVAAESPGGNTSYPADAKTFTVNENGRSFTATQPRNSVATYTWTDGGAPQEWLTSANGSQLDRRMTRVRVTAQGTPTDTIAVDKGRTYQTIDGFGGAMTDSAAATILGASNRDQAMGLLFGTGSGQAGLTMVRSPMGSSDLMAEGDDFHTYEDSKGSFSADATASDRRQIDALQRAKSIAGGNFKLIGTPWSAPGWAKRGGALKPKGCGIEANELDVRQAGAYADYFRKYVDAYAARGIKPWMVSLQNEPQNCKTAMPTTLLSAADSVALAGQLKAKLPGDVKVLGWDHNWNDRHFVDALTASGRFDAVGYHCYDGTHYATQTTAVATYMTECSGFTDSSANVAQNLGWQVSNMLMGPLRYGSKGSIYWSLAQDANGDPHLNSADACRTCRGMLTRNASGQLEPSQDFYYYAQFSAFVKPGSVRIESSNSGDVSTVAFRNGNTTTLVVLVSGSHRADGGSAGSDERDLRRHILQFNGENVTQKTAWLVGADGYRRWINDGSTFNCLKYDAGMQGPDDLPGGALDKYINLEHVWAVCGAYTMGNRSQLEVGTYIKSGGGARLTLTSSGLRAVDSTGQTRRAPGGTGDRLVLQEDQNLVLYAGGTAVWASGTAGSGAAWLSIRDDGTFVLTDKANKKVWVSETGTRDYRRRIVQYDGDTAAQKTAWLVGNDGNRRWVPDLPTFQCLQSADSGNPISLSSDVLDKVPNLDGVWAACGTDRIGPNGAVEAKGYLKAGDYRLTLTASELVLTRSGTRVWAPGRGGEQLKLQTDGNLVMYDKQGGATWATGTSGKSAGWLVLGDDGSLRLYDAGGRQVWTR